MARTTRTRFWRTAPGVAALAALALTACATDDDAAEFEDAEAASQAQSADDNGDQTQQEEPASNGAEDEEAANTESAEGGPTQAEDASRHPDNAQQVTTYPLPEVEGEMTMGLQTLVAGDEGLLLSVSFVPEYEDEDPLTMFELHGPRGSTGNNAYLLPTLSDRQNFKQYYVPTPEPRHRAQGWAGRSADAWATQLEGFGLRSGEVFTMWAYFPLPEDDIETVDVSVVPGAPEFQDVEIDWGDLQPGEGSGADAQGSSDNDDADGEE